MHTTARKKKIEHESVNPIESIPDKHPSINLDYFLHNRSIQAISFWVINQISKLNKKRCEWEAAGNWVSAMGALGSRHFRLSPAREVPIGPWDRFIGGWLMMDAAEYSIFDQTVNSDMLRQAITAHQLCPWTFRLDWISHQTIIIGDTRCRS